MQKLTRHVFENYPLHCFIVFHFVIWSMLPMFRIGAPMDSMEAVWWGKFCFLGTNKHPPLSGFPAYAYYLAFADNLKSVYILSQTCILAGFIFIYKLAQNLLHNQYKAVLSVMLLEGVVFYGYCTPEYNVNVLSLALWPANAYYFYRATKEDKTSAWILAGIFSALNILNKYTAILELIGMALYLLSSARMRRLLKSPKPYLGLTIFLLLVLPHFYWLAKHDFFVIKYFSSLNQTKDFSWLMHLVYPLKFLLSMVLYSLGTFSVFYLFFGIKRQNNPDKEGAAFLFCLSIIPLLLILLYSFISGNNIKSMWGFPLLYLLGITLLFFFKASLSAKNFVQIQKAIYALMLVFAIIYSSVLLLNASPKYNLNGKEFAKEYTQLWQEKASKPLKYVIGDVWLASIMVLESQDKPAPVIWGELERNPWINKNDFRHEGALILAESLNEYKNYQNRCNQQITPPHEVIYEFSGRFKKRKQKRIYYGFYKGETK